MFERDERLARLLSGGPRFDRAEARAAGIGDEELRALRTSGLVVSPHRGVYEIAGTPASWLGGLQAMLLAAGPLAVASHRAAAAVHELGGFTASGPFEIMGPILKHARPPGALVHRSTRLAPELVVVRKGVRVLSVGWTLCTLGAVVPPLTVEKCVETAIRRGWTSESGLDALLRSHGGRGVRGTGVLRAVLDSRPEGAAAASVFEVDVLACLRRAGLPMPEREVSVRLPDGTVAKLDLAYSTAKVAIFAEGDEFHYTRAQREWDRDVMNWLQELGWEVLRYGYWDPKRRPGYVVNRVSRALASAGVRVRF